ncbi:MAG TPA: protein-tyrosine kinase [Candidatus Scybalocola faecavium]|nr:protein-tyrosine kinase [Candidatus Scybalocola faecavium]
MEKQFQDDEVEIDLRELFAVLMDKILWILLAGVACGVAAFLVTKLFMTPMYSSSTQIYVLSKQNSETMSYNDLQLSTQLAEDCAALIQSRTVTSQVIEELGLDMTDEQLASSISVEEVSSSGRVIQITVSYPDPVMAQRIADTIREVAAGNFVEIMDLEAVNTVEEANLPDSPSSPNTKMYTLLGLLGGIVVAAAVVIIVFITNDKIRTQDDVEKYLGISVLGVIPDSDEGMNNEEQVNAQKQKKVKKK